MFPGAVVTGVNRSFEAHFEAWKRKELKECSNLGKTIAARSKLGRL
jgi:hypothetical protein